MQKIKFLFLIVLLFPSLAFGAIAVDTVSSGTNNGLTVTVSHTVGSGSDRAMVVCAGVHQGTISTVTYGGAPLTRLDSATTAFNEKAELWYLDDPTTGTANVVVTQAGGSETQAVVVSYTGAGTTGAVASSTGTGTQFFTSITNTGIDSWNMDCANSEAGLTIANGLTQRGNLTGSGAFEVTASQTATTSDRGANMMRYTIASSQRYAHSLMELTSASPGAYTITTDGTSNSGELATVSSATYSHTTTAGSNKAICVTSAVRDASNTDVVITGITFNGDALTKVRSDVTVSGDYTSSEIWCMANPDVATGNVVVTYTGTVNFAASYANSFFGVDQADIDAGNNGGNSTSAGSSTVAVTTDTANCVLIDAIFETDAPGVITHATDQLETYFTDPNSNGDVQGFSKRRTTTTGSYNMTWVWVSGTQRYGHSAMCLKPAAGGGIVSTPNTIIQTRTIMMTRILIP